MTASSKISALIILTFVVNISGCPGNRQKAGEVQTAKETIAASLNSSFQLRHNQSAIIESDDLSVKFLNVAEDSRCPVGVECIWAGQAKIELRIRFDDSEPVELTLTSQAGREELAIAQLNGYVFKLAEVNPLRRPNRELTQSDYSITMEISRLGDINR